MFPGNEYVYPTMIVLGLIVGLSYIIRVFWYRKLSLDTLQGLLIITFFSGFIMLVGALFFDALFHYLGDRGLWAMQGVTFLSGLICGIAAFCVLFLIYYKKEWYNLLSYLNVIITGVVISHAFGRIGCFLHGCCFGVPSNWWWGIVFPEGSAAFRMYGTTPLIPVQIIEAVFLFGLATFMILYKKHQTLIYTLSYGIFRFIIEFYRGDDRGARVFGLHPSQFIALLMIIGGLIWLICLIVNHFHKKHLKIDAESIPE